MIFVLLNIGILKMDTLDSSQFIEKMTKKLDNEKETLTREESIFLLNYIEALELALSHAAGVKNNNSDENTLLSYFEDEIKVRVDS